MKCRACGAEVPPDTWRCWACDRALPARAPAGRARRDIYAYRFLTASASALRPERTWQGALVLIGVLILAGVVPVILLYVSLQPNNAPQSTPLGRLVTALPNGWRQGLPLPTTPQAHYFGQAIAVEGLVVQVLSPRHLRSVPGQQAPPGQEFLVAEVMLNARGPQAARLERRAWSAQDDQGNRYPLVSLSGSDWLADGTARPGEVIATRVAFLVPTGREIAVEYRPVGRAAGHIWRAVPAN